MSDIKKLVGTIVKVTKKIAVASNNVIYGTVLSRNPDGTLNVDLGNGGCTIVAAAANVRVGDKIVIGTQPQVGTTTSLDPLGVPLPGAPECPMVPKPPLAPLQAFYQLNTIKNYFDGSWRDERGVDFGLVFPTIPYSQANVGGKPFTWYRGPTAPSPQYENARAFFEFDTSKIVPPGAGLVDLNFRFVVSSGAIAASLAGANGTLWSESDSKVYLVPAPLADDFTLSTYDTANMPKAMIPRTPLPTDPPVLIRPLTPLGSMRIRDIVLADTWYTISAIPPNATADDLSRFASLINFGGLMKFALVTEFDLRDDTPPLLHPTLAQLGAGSLIGAEVVSIGSSLNPYPFLDLTYLDL